MLLQQAQFVNTLLLSPASQADSAASLFVKDGLELFTDEDAAVKLIQAQLRDILYILHRFRTKAATEAVLLVGMAVAPTVRGILIRVAHICMSSWRLGIANTLTRLFRLLFMFCCGPVVYFEPTFACAIRLQINSKLRAKVIHSPLQNAYIFLLTCHYTAYYYICSTE